MANTIGWGKGTQNNSNGWGKFQNTIGAASIYEDSYAGETVLIGTSAAFSYSASSFHQGEADPTPTITGTTGGTFSATPSGLSINTSTGTIDLDNSTIQSYTITYTVSGVSANQTLAVTASPFIANNFSMEFDGASSYVNAGNILNQSGTDAFSISGWFYLNSTKSNTIVSKMNSSFVGYQLYVNAANKLKFLLQGTGNLSATGSTVLSLNTWYNVILTYDGSGTTGGINLFLNGATESFTGSGSNSGGVSNSENFEIGARTGAVDVMDGKIDEVALWNTGLSSDAVTEIYNATYNNTGKVLDLNTDSGNYTSSANLTYWNRMGD